MLPVDEARAWKIVHAFARDCLRRDPGNLRAIYAVGPLAGGYFQANSNHLQVAIIAADQARPVWGRYFAPGPALSVLNERYRRTYQLSSESGAAVLLENELTPPYVNVQAAPLIARLKMEGRLLWGSADLDRVPMPAAHDLLHAARQYERWWNAAYPGEEDIFQLDLATCTGAIREHIFRYLWIEYGQIEFNPLRQLERFQKVSPPGLDRTALHLVERYQCGQDLSAIEIDLLRSWLLDLRVTMNAYLRI